MTAKCQKCGAVFEYAMGISLIHVGPLKYIRCPACGKRSMMNTALRPCRLAGASAGSGEATGRLVSSRLSSLTRGNHVKDTEQCSE